MLTTNGTAVCGIRSDRMIRMEDLVEGVHLTNRLLSKRAI